MNRKTDGNNGKHDRSDRMTLLGDAWYFNTREGRLIGPYQSEPEAMGDLTRYINLAEAGRLDTGSFSSIPSSDAVNI